MRHFINITSRMACLTLVLTTLFGCFSDDSTEGGDFQDIAVKAFEESYSRVSYMGQHLQISPEVSTTIAAEQLEHQWTIQRDNPPATSAAKDDIYKSHVISTARNLDYEVNLAPGVYTLVYTVRNATNDYRVTQSTKLLTTTAFSQGFYILKATDDGHTDLDLLLEDGTHSQDILTNSREGGALEGEPLDINIAYDHCYIDEETNKNSATNMIAITTRSGQLAMFRTADMQQVYDNSNICFAPMAAATQPYSVYTGSFGVHFLTSEGAMTNYGGAVSGGTSSGKYGIPEVETGGSKYIAGDGMYTCYWDEANRQICAVDFNGGVAVCTTMMGEAVDLSGYDCVAAGTNIMGSICFMLKDRTSGKLVVYELTPGMYSLDNNYEVSAESAINGATAFAFNYLQATVVYGIKNNKVYAYDYYSGNDQELQLQGIGSGETISYVSNQFFSPMSGTKFDYLFVATTTASGYTLYAYNMLGGLADGAPVFKVSGTGRPSGVRYVSSTFAPMSDGFGVAAIPLGD